MVLEKTFAAEVDLLPDVLAYLDSALEENDCNMKAQMQLDIAVEEIFVNIAHYAYTPNKGDANIRLEFVEDYVEITFVDHGMYFDPVSKEDPDITAKAEDRDIGGLGIYMVKRSMDKVAYERLDNANVLKIRKKIR